MKAKRTSGKRRKAGRPGSGRRRRETPTIDVQGVQDVVAGVEAIGAPSEPGQIVTGGDVTADAWRVEASGDEAVGGSVATPDQDVVDEIGRALGVERPDEEELRTSSEILSERDRFRWHLERDAEDEAEGRPHRRRGTV